VIEETDERELIPPSSSLEKLQRVDGSTDRADFFSRRTAKETANGHE
jgi:hypothetical protein